MNRLTRELIAPCGMNCGVCVAHLREKNVCPGCNRNVKKTSCLNCKIKVCNKRRGDYCFECEEFPCAQLKQMNKRYELKYEMSEIDNLNTIKEKGIEPFVKSERKRWQSARGLYCVHNKKYY